MTTSRIKVLFSALALAFSLSASAQVYLGGSLGIGFMKDIDAVSTKDAGARAGLHIGYTFDNFRVELESVGQATAWEFDNDSFVRASALMVNGFYDFDKLMQDSNIVPYVGAGIGYAAVDTDILGTTSEGSAAYQAIAGASMDLNDNWSLFADYRYMGTFSRVTPELMTISGSTIASQRYGNHSVNIGVSYRFG